MKSIRKIRSAQMRIQEMSFMIIGLFVFFTLILLFYLTISSSGLKKTAEASSREKAILLIARLAGSPEFGCPSGASICVDSDKLLALKEDTVYATFWDIPGLKVEKVFPSWNDSVECNFVNYERCNTFTIVEPKGTSLIRDTSFVSLCRKDYKNGYLYDKCELAKIVAYSEKTA